MALRAKKNKVHALFGASLALGLRQL